MLHGHGNDKYKYSKAIVADFSSNVWFEGTPKALTNYLVQNINTISEYPEPDAGSLATNIEQHYNLSKGACMVTNGTAEAFYVIARYFEKKSSTVVIPSFAEYEDAVRFNNHKISFVMNGTLSADSTFNTDMVWLGNPNNPDGKVLSYQTIQTWLRNNGNTIFIIDEAYADLCIGYNSVIPLINEHQNLIVIKSYTKSFAIPGLRLGVILAHAGFIDKFKFYMIPWSVNSLAQQAGKYIIRNYNSLLFSAELMNKLSQNMQQALSENTSLELTPSQCNYFLLKLKVGDSLGLKQWLINNHGYLIRDASNFRGLSTQHFRVAIQDEELNNKLVEAIREFCGSI